MWKSCKNLTIIFALSCIGGNIFYMLGDWRVTHDFLLCSHSAHKEAVEPHGGVLSANLSILSKQLSVRKWDSSRWVAHTRVKKISVNSSPVSFFIYNPTIPNTTFSITAEKRKKEEKKKEFHITIQPHRLRQLSTSCSPDPVPNTKEGTGNVKPHILQLADVFVPPPMHSSEPSTMTPLQHTVKGCR